MEIITTASQPNEKCALEVVGPLVESLSKIYLHFKMCSVNL